MMTTCKANSKSTIDEGKNRKSGAWKGKVKIVKDFDKLPADFMKHFES